MERWYPIRSGDRPGLRQEDLVGLVELHLHRRLDLQLRHRGAEPGVAERAERGLALPGVEVVAVVAVPPGEVGEPAGRGSFEPADLRADRVVLRLAEVAKNHVSDDGHVPSLSRPYAA